MKKQKLDRQYAELTMDEQEEIMATIIRPMIDRVKSDNPGYGGEGLLFSEDKKEVISRLWHLNLLDSDDSTFHFCERLYKTFVRDLMYSSLGILAGNPFSKEGTSHVPDLCQ